MSAPEHAAELRATYRLQLTSSFGFGSARALVPYLRDLGISHLYLSPSFQARPGSTHGYDVVDPGRISDALGGEAEFQQLSDEARSAGMGIVLDIVPNHMAADDANRYWADPELRRRFFDIDEATGHYRRFFDIDDLAAIRQEDPEVFEATHELALRLLREGVIDGVRVDHPDGLADPGAYLSELASRGAQRVWVEKILDPGERLRDWPVSGTVGYEFLNDVCGLFVDPAGEGPLTALWKEVSGDGRPFGEVAFEAKLEQASGTFRREVERLTRELDAESGVLWEGNSASSTEELARALSSLPVYRTYIAEGRIEDADRQAIAHLQPPFQRLLLSDGPPRFITRFQQTTPAIMAKGVEDTAFYRYGRLLALNDVGGDPSRFGVGVNDFHAGNAERAERFPLNLVTTMTHDAKRSADVRARIAGLAGMAEEWRAQVERWFELTEPLRDGGAPDDVERYFIFQTLVGAWPIEAERIGTYMEKALREAKRNTNWVEQNHEWETAVKRFCAALYTEHAFLAEFEPFAARVAAAGERSALGQLVLKLTVPGVPDIYQGDELPYRALVDPDNRRPVDWRWRQALLRRLMGGSPPTGASYKLFLILRLLGLRARRPETFLRGGYEPVEAGAEICAFLRGDDVLVVAALRSIPDDAPLALPGGRWRDVLSGEERSFSSPQPARRLIGERGLAIYERLAVG
ncbi:MAG TPA: malto-oligosyltrehalose synthase [Solirubrobacteraceae bacterium]|nr:malto-oligosyltrehalose synthase [Solirubrobacteraceae bacterium]